MQDKYKYNVGFEMFLVDDESEAIGFTACGSSSRVYDEEEIVLFD